MCTWYVRVWDMCACVHVCVCIYVACLGCACAYVACASVGCVRVCVEQGGGIRRGREMQSLGLWEQAVAGACAQAPGKTASPIS